MPIMLSAPMAKAPIVHGMRRPIPSSWLTSVTCAAVWSEPAAKNKVILPNAWAGDVHGRAGDRQRRQDGRAEDDIGQAGDTVE